MGTEIHLRPAEVWPFYLKNRERLNKEMVIIAENTDTEYAVYLTDYCGQPQFLVCKGDEEPEYKELADITDCGDIAMKFYTNYLFPVTVTNDKYPLDDEFECSDGEMTRQEMEDSQYEREDELQLALCDFLAVVLKESEEDPVEILNTYGASFIDEVLNYFLEYLGEEHCLPIYRPMIVIDEDTGYEIFTEFPYDIDSEHTIEDDETIMPTGGWK